MGPGNANTFIKIKGFTYGCGLGNAVFFQLQEFKNNSNVLYFAGYKQHTDVFCENILKT